MATEAILSEADETLADLIDHLGGIPLNRIRLKPAPGTATEDDLVALLEAPRKRICELVDGVLVEKAVGTKEGLLAGLIIHFLWDFLEEDDLGVVIGADGPLRLWLGLVRIPDVSYVSWDRIPGGQFPDTPIASLIPNLAVEVLSAGNTKKEMERKLQEFFRAGVELVWLIEPKTQSAKVYTSPTKMRRVAKDQALEGGRVLPGFVLPLRELFARANRRNRKSR